MSPFMARMLFIFVLMFAATSLRRFLAHRPVQHQSGKNLLEMPSGVQRIGYRVMVLLTSFIVFMTLISFFMQDIEMIIVCSIMTLMFATITYFTRRKFKRFYEESNEAFELKNEYWVFHVAYENIIDWVPVRKQIGVLDKTQLEDRYICVNLTFSDPEILLRKLAEMTFSGKFKQTENGPADDPNREQEFIQHLKINGYGHIVEEFLTDEAKAEN